MPKIRIKSVTPDKPVFGNIKKGEMFLFDGELYIRIEQPIGYGYNVVRIRDGNIYCFNQSTLVVPVLQGTTITIE